MRIPLFALLLFLFSCSGETETAASDSVTNDSTTTTLRGGTLTDRSCSGDASNTYALYLPATFETNAEFPVVIFFDAHGSGRLPLERYKAIADKWNFILVGSNSSRNGMQSNETMRIGNGLIDDVLRTLPVDPHKVMLCGFSGGARVAAMLGTTREDVKSVICNSAAPQQAGGKAFIGLAGLGDMNYLEMKKFSDAQTGDDRTFELLVFDGKHEWAPADVMEHALLAATVHLAGKSQLPDSSDYKMAAALGASLEQEADSMEKTSCLLAKNLLEAGERIVKPYNNWKAQELPDAGCVKREANEWATIEKQESSLQEHLQESLLARDTTWWRAHANEYFETAQSGPEKFMRQRLRGYMSLTCYTYAGQALRMKNEHAAEKFVTVYSIIDPENSEWAYMRATLYMQLGMNDYAIGALEKAIALGFNDRNRLLSDPAFTPIQTDARFTALVARL